MLGLGLLSAASAQAQALPEAQSQINASAGASPVPAKTANTAESSSFQISGTVVNRLTGMPLARCQLAASLITDQRRVGGLRTQAALGARPGRVNLSTGAAAPLMTDTDLAGRFMLSLPQAGAYQVRASAAGFESMALDEHEGFSSSVVVTNAKPTIDVMYRMSPESTLSGRVLDEGGEPVRRAAVSLWVIRPPLIENPAPAPQRRNATQTDDRGYYEFGSLQAGRYQVSVQAAPWYATSSQALDRVLAGVQKPAYPEPSLDVVYPVVWFPGFDTPERAETLSLKIGENRSADFHLLPQPALHLHVRQPPVTDTGLGGRRISGFFNGSPQVQRLLPGGVQGSSGITLSLPNGDLDVGGLTPGTYLVRDPGPEARQRIVRVAAGSTGLQELPAGEPYIRSTILLDGAPAGARITISMSDPQTGSVYQTSTDQRPGRVRGGIVGGVAGEPQVGQPLTIDAPAGTYRMLMNSSLGLYVSEVTAEGAAASGRQVIVHGGAPVITLYLKSGRAMLSGFVHLPAAEADPNRASGVKDSPAAAKSGDTASGVPSVSAVVLLVPATLGDPGSIDQVRRDQSNTDGSYSLADVLPGQYILIAIDHGWELNLADPSTLNRYLIHGIPLDVKQNAELKQEIEAQQP